MSPTKRASIEIFSPDEAPMLAETGMMSMPTVDPPADDELVEWAMSPGHVVKVLYRDGGDGGMSLVWSWFGPNYVLPRHSHDADCLYYVVAGAAHLGNRVVAAGGGFFVPAGAPYAYSAGPDGVQVLEFRGTSSFDMQITEKPERWQKIVETVRANRDDWARADAHG